MDEDYKAMILSELTNPKPRSISSFAKFQRCWNMAKLYDKGAQERYARGDDPSHVALCVRASNHNLCEMIQAFFYWITE